MISPLCDDNVINYFDAIATAIRLYDRAKVFLDLRNGPLRFISMNTPYSIIFDENTGDLRDDYYNAILTLSQLMKIKQIERVFVAENSNKVRENMCCSGIVFESLESLSLNKEFSVENLSFFDCDFILKIIASERTAMSIKIPNMEINLIQLEPNGKILINQEYVSLNNIEQKIREIELCSLREKTVSETQYLNQLLDFFGAAITDDYYCYLNPRATLEDYSNYKVRLVKWFFQLQYSDLSNYSGNNCVVERLLSCINTDSVILPKDYFLYKPFEFTS